MATTSELRAELTTLLNTDTENRDATWAANIIQKTKDVLDAMDADAEAAATKAEADIAAAKKVAITDTDRAAKRIALVTTMFTGCNQPDVSRADFGNGVDAVIAAADLIIDRIYGAAESTEE